MSSSDFGNPDVVVVGAGNAGLLRGARGAGERRERDRARSGADRRCAAATAATRAGACASSTTASTTWRSSSPISREEEKKTTTSAPTPTDQYFDDMGRITQYIARPRHDRAADHEEPRDAGVAAQERRALPAELRPPGVQGRGRRSCSGAVWRREPGAAAAGLVESEHKACGARRHRSLLRDAGARAGHR